MADKKAERNVWVGDRLYLAGDSVPKEDADLITNEKVWTKPEEAKKADSAADSK